MLEQQRTRDAQNNPQHPDKDDVVKISVTLVQVDAVVTDKSGRQVTDLKPEDFEISEDGKTQRITNFAYVPVNQPAAATSVTATAAVTPAPVKPKEKVAIPPPPRLRPEQIRRTVALMVDDLSLSFTSVDSVRAALKKFVDEQMQQGDLVAIIRTSAGMGVLQQFTADKRRQVLLPEKQAMKSASKKRGKN
jgi:VWFA-related protein